MLNDSQSLKSVFDTYKRHSSGHGGGGQVVTMLAFDSNVPSSNCAEAYSFSVKFVFEKNTK